MRFLILLVLWFILLAVCWPLAVLLLIAVPAIYLLLLPFRLAVFVIEAVFSLIRSILFLPARVLGG